MNGHHTDRHECPKAHLVAVATDRHHAMRRLPVPSARFVIASTERLR
jgi:hypothetical protein